VACQGRGRHAPQTGRRSAVPFSSGEFFKIEWRRWAASLAFYERRPQRLEFGFLLLQQSQAGPYHVAGAAVAALTDLSLDEAAEILTDAE
jgi:hypothetical protein